MNVYLETSALVKLFLEEPEADLARDLWDDADLVTVSRVAYPEARAVFAAARRGDRITSRELAMSRRRIDAVWRQVQVVDLDEPIARGGGALAETHALKGFDAVHLATALASEDESLVVASWDTRLRAASLDSGLRVAPARASG